MILAPTSENIQNAARKIVAGELVSFPTETVYGLGANAYSNAACGKIYTLKGRPSHNPLVVHVSDLDQIGLITSFSSLEESERFLKLATLWPAPLTIVMRSNGRVSQIATAGGDTVAVRMPNHPIALELIRRAAVPIAAPSANRSNYISPTTAQHVEDEFSSSDLTILDGGACNVGIESTIVDITREIPRILRPGVITIEAIERSLNERIESKLDLSADQALPSPGLLKRHYSPNTRTIRLSQLNSDHLPPNSVLVSLGSARASKLNPPQIVQLSPSNKLEEVAAALYSTLRELDKQGHDLIILDECDPEGIGAALLDRITRATTQE